MVNTLEKHGRLKNTVYMYHDKLVLYKGKQQKTMGKRTVHFTHACTVGAECDHNNAKEIISL